MKRAEVAGTPVQAVRRAKVSSAVLSGTIDIANSLQKAFTLEFSLREFCEVHGIALPDTGADVNLVTESLVAALEQKSLVCRRLLSAPIMLGSVNEVDACLLTHYVTLPVRIGERFFEEDFAIAPIPAPPHLILGIPWFENHCPGVLTLLEEFGFKDEMMSSPPYTPRSLSFVTSAELTPVTSPCPTPIACRPSSDPLAAFSAGGVFAALEAEEQRRKDIESTAMVAATHFHHCLIARSAVKDAIYSHLETARVRLAALSASADDPGVRGLTGNREGWLETIPPEFRHHADTVFSDLGAAGLPAHRPGYDCEITIKEGEKLKTSKIYDMSQEQLRVLKQLLDVELAKGFLRPSKSESSAPVFFVRDPPSESRNQGQLRMVVDYRDLNSKIVLDEYPIPLSRQVMEDLASADWITAFDVRSGFANIRVAPGSEKHAAFKTFYGLFEPTVMPMGLATAPSVFQRFVNSILNPFLGVFCHAYLDDIVIYTKGSRELHSQQVAQVLDVLAKNDLHLKPHKCQWFRKEVSFLGFHVECGKGVRMADDKLQALRDMKPPRSVSDLRSFLGSLGFYDKFIPHYSDIVACLTDLTKKDAPWQWLPDPHQRAWDRLMKSLRDDVFLAGFDPELPIRLSTDASDVAYGGKMEQPRRLPDGPNGEVLWDDTVWRPFLMYHHKFKDGEKGWDAPDKELYAIVYAFSRYRKFLAQPRFPVAVYSDHRNLAKFMFSSNLLKSHDGRLGRWWEELSQCNFQIQYTPGTTNVVPDWLSRYGFDASVDPDPRTLLPSHRFSPKALTDIELWFKKSPTSPNVRKILEENFARASPSLAHGKIQNGSPDPVQAAPAPTRPFAPASSPPAAPVSKERLILSSLPARLARLAAGFMPGYIGTKLDSVLPDYSACRFGRDRFGLGAS
ncbi:MAG TPA: pol polyprotein [Verrucomicrobiae bacterium]|nr:pol polyprotein [Verrucomicrobiae bacterium]